MTEAKEPIKDNREDVCKICQYRKSNIITLSSGGKVCEDCNRVIAAIYEFI